MKSNLLYTIIFFALAISISCNQSQDQNQGSLQTKQTTDETSTPPNNEPVQKKSSANFIIVSEVHEAMEKSPNNQNPGHRNIYSVYVENFNDKDDNVWTDMSVEAKSKPHDLNGFTAVFFFSNKANTPSINKGLEWPEKYDKYCVGGYWYYWHPHVDAAARRQPGEKLRFAHRLFEQ